MNDEAHEELQIAKGARKRAVAVRAASKTPSTPSAPAGWSSSSTTRIRENEGDLTIAAEKVTPEAINFMARYGRGLICLSMTPERLDELDIPLMVSQNTLAVRDRRSACRSRRRARRRPASPPPTARATVLAAIDPATRPSDLARPGHMFPLRSRTGGVLVRAGQTEAAVDLARIAGLYPAGVDLRNHERGRHDGARAAAWRSSRSGTAC